MSKKLVSTLFLFFAGIGAGGYSIYSLINYPSPEGRFFSFVYLGVAVVAFGALIMLPFKKE